MFTKTVIVAFPDWVTSSPLLLTQLL